MGMALVAVGDEQKRCDLQWKFIVVAVGCHNGLLRYVDFRGWTWIQTQTQTPCLGINSSHLYWFSFFFFSNLQILLLLASFFCLIIDFPFTCLISVNSDEAVSSTNRLKAFILKAFHGLLNRFGFLVLSLDSFDFLFLDDWINFCLITFNFRLIATSFSFKNAVIKAKESISKALDHLVKRFGF